jgi:hypothetical protein
VGRCQRHCTERTDRDRLIIALDRTTIPEGPERPELRRIRLARRWQQAVGLNERIYMRLLTISCVLLGMSLAAQPSFAQKEKKTKEEKKEEKKQEEKKEAPPPGNGTLKPGQAVGVRKCLASAAGVGNIDATNSRTIGVANCRNEIQKVFLSKGICTAHKKGDKIDYSWQFADTTGMYYVLCP